MAVSSGIGAQPCRGATGPAWLGVKSRGQGCRVQLEGQSWGAELIRVINIMTSGEEQACRNRGFPPGICCCEGSCVFSVCVGAEGKGAQAPSWHEDDGARVSQPSQRMLLCICAVTVHCRAEITL